MTDYPAVRKTAHHAPALAELEFAMHRWAARDPAEMRQGTRVRIEHHLLALARISAQEERAAITQP